MSETLITGGLIAVEDGAKQDPADQYSLSRKVRVELRFDINENTPAAGRADIVQLVGDQAAAEVARLLGRQPQATVVNASPPAEKPATRTRKAAGATPSPSPAPSETVEDPSSVSDPASVPTAEVPSSTNDAVVKDDAAVVIPTEAPSGGAAEVANGDEVVEDWEIVAGEPEAPVSDADLNAAVQKRNGELGNPTLIRTLIGEFNPDPTKSFQLRQIEPAQRAGFLAKLAALK